jgi:hypothetical protein
LKFNKFDRSWKLKSIYAVLMTSVLLIFGSVAVANEPAKGPLILSDAQLDIVIAGDNGVDHTTYHDSRGADKGGANIPYVGDAWDEAQRGASHNNSNRSNGMKNGTYFYSREPLIKTGRYK